MKTIVCDVEADGLDPDNIWIVHCLEIETGEQKTFRHCSDNPKPVVEYLNNCDKIIGHNFISYDIKVLRKLLPGLTVKNEDIIDTLILSKLIKYKRQGGHSLESYGEELGYPKDKYSDFSKWSQELENRCIIDVDLNFKVYLRFVRFLNDPEWIPAIELEHAIAFVCEDIKNNGFYFDIDKCNSLFKHVSNEVESRLKVLKKEFPPKPKFIKEITPKLTKHGTLNASPFRSLSTNVGFSFDHYSDGASFSVIDWEEFNPASPKQIVSRLNDAGWEPVEKTKGHLKAIREKKTDRLEYFKEYGYTCSEKNLDTLPPTAPEGAKTLASFILLSSRKSTLAEWLKAYNEETHSIHGRLDHIGSWTHRMSHSNPNMANIPSIVYSINSPRDELKAFYNHPMREMWTVPEGYKLIGTDADGIQLRILAHYMDDNVFTTALVKGNKDDGTDAHSLNARTLGNDITRDTAKTYIYAWILGAAHQKQADILEKSIAYAKNSEKNFLEKYPSLHYIKKTLIPKDAQRGFFIGIDGRKVICDSEHLMLAGYLQNAEAIIMKKANLLWLEELHKLGIPNWQVNFVHDEWQTQVPDDESIIQKVMEVQSQSIVDAGLHYELKCPLAGTSDVGINWKETH